MTREDAIKHLENMKWMKGYSNTTVDGVPIGNVIDGIIALLKEQEPRVMTLEEFNAHWQIPPQERKPIWEEWKVDNGKGKWKLYGRATGGYGDMWRCWTSRPDQATREAVKWDAQEQREYEAAVEMAEYCERYEPTYNADDGSM